jgi:hypothetical protein
MSGLLSGLHGDGTDSDAHCWSDACTFLMEGIPTADLAIDAVKYDDTAHTAGDTIDKVSSGWLASGAALMAVTAYAIADAPERMSPRIDHAAVGKYLKATDRYDEFVSGGWKP